MNTTQPNSPEQILRWWQSRYGRLTSDQQTAAPATASGLVHTAGRPASPSIGCSCSSCGRSSRTGHRMTVEQTSPMTIEVEAFFAPAAVPWTGTSAQRRAAVVGLVGGLAVTAVYVVVARYVFDTATTQIEFWSLVASLACVWLCRTENVLANPIGIVAVVLTGIYFLRIDLPGQGWLQLGFYVPVQFVSWWAWCRGGAGGTALKVTRLGVRGWALVLTGALAAWAICWLVFRELYGPLEWQGWDTSIVAASVTAQLLMTAKKLESWLWWQLPVNVSAIGLYAVTGAWAFGFLYVVYLINAMSGFALWRRAPRWAPLRRGPLGVFETPSTAR